ncbi:hypothetical protein BGY98DRAFT_146020 [Russula aff. rugulosa BPL654]|nr:hypothetical protein BGY98DRAFT_146020 [Russula aff. rugulosa BPL654]
MMSVASSLSSSTFDAESISVPMEYVPSPSLPQMPLRKSAVYELELKDLEALANHQLITVQEKLLEGLSNCRALESVIRDSFTSIKRKYRRAGQETLRTSVPQIDDELAESLRVLAELEARLPVIRTQAIKISSCMIRVVRRPKRSRTTSDG